jgi:CRP-like cAMP-binding protein
MAVKASNPVNALKQAMADFAVRNPDSVVKFARGHRLIEEGAEGSDFYLVQQGSFSILVKSPTDGREKEVALRFEGDLIGEMAILQRRGRRTASVVVDSQQAALVRLDRQDVLTLIKEDATVAEAIIAIWELAAARRAETQKVLGGEVQVENKLMSVLLADIHSFSMLGELVPDELSESFLFEFIESSERACQAFEGIFEDQGDGFKIIFEGIHHVGRAVACADILRQNFLMLRTRWTQQNKSFHDIGLGVGVCTDCMSIRRRVGSRRSSGWITSHAITIAAAIAKYKTSPSDVEVYLDDTTASMLRTNEFAAEMVGERFLEHLGRRQSLHKLAQKQDAVSTSTAEDCSEESLATEDRISILFVAADPSSKQRDRLRLDQEVREIQEQIQLSRLRPQFAFHQRHALRPGDLSQALLDIEPEIVHFSGHGTGAGGLCFEGPDGKVQMVSSEALSALFKEFTSTVKCVVLNACYSEAQAASIVKHVSYVIGMKAAIGDRAAIAFGKGFYQALGAGKKFEDAYRLGCIRIALECVGSDESQLPVLKIREMGVRP